MGVVVACFVSVATAAPLYVFLCVNLFIQSLLHVMLQAARMGLSLKAYKVQKEQEEYARRRAAEGGDSATPDWTRLVPTNAEDEDAQLARVMEASLNTR
eukprot:5715711-Pyramimonas_sp.AAC.1